MNRNRWRAMLMAMMVVAFSVVTISCDDDEEDNGPSTEANYTISGNAAGSQMVPAVSGTGTGTITGTYNPNTRVMTYTNTWAGLSGAPTGGGFYTGASGVSGTAFGTPWSYDGTATATGTYSSTITLTEAQEDQLIDGNMYYGYNTTANANGEIRGQMTAVQQ